LPFDPEVTGELLPPVPAARPATIAIIASELLFLY